MKKLKLVKSSNSKFFKLMVNILFFSEKQIKKNVLSINPFYSDNEIFLKEELKKLKDQRCMGYINALVEKGDAPHNFLKKHREQGNLKVRLVKNYNKNDELIIINTAGGLTSGDVNFNSIKVGRNIVLNITTQSMEKVYKCKNLLAYAYTNIDVGSGSYLSWLPLETIFFNEGKLRRRTNIDLKKDSNFLGVETIIFGRKAMGEIISKGELDDGWQIYKSGKLLYSDFNRINGNINKKIANSLIMKENNIFCNIVYTGKKIKTYLKKILIFIDKSKCFAGASIVNQVLLIKVLSKDINDVRCFVENLVDILDENFNLPKIWSF